VLVFDAEAFIKEKLETVSPPDDWQPLFVHDFDEARHVLTQIPVSCFVVNPYIKSKNGLEIIAQFCWQFETIPVVLYSSSFHPDSLSNAKLLEKNNCLLCNTLEDLLSAIPVMIRTHAFQPEVKIFGIDLRQCSLRVKKAVRMMIDEFRENITVDEIAHRLGVHRSHLEREWHRQCGSITIKQLLIGLKLHYSTFLMQNEGLKLKDIARLAGFANEHSFYRSFHRHMGMIASRYRKDYTFADFRAVYRSRQKTEFYATK
jgi:AraC-like DNA-binding protein